MPTLKQVSQVITFRQNLGQFLALQLLLASLEVSLLLAVVDVQFDSSEILRYVMASKIKKLQYVVAFVNADFMKAKIVPKPNECYQVVVGYSLQQLMLSVSHQFDFHLEIFTVEIIQMPCEISLDPS